jgi:hypothetical protein
MNVYRILVEKAEGKRTLGRPIRKWEDNIVTDLPGKSSIDTVQYATIDKAIFSVDPTDAPIGWLDSDHVIYV